MVEVFPVLIGFRKQPNKACPGSVPIPEPRFRVSRMPGFTPDLRLSEVKAQG